MYGKWFILFLLTLLPSLLEAQTYVYSYTDPCTGILKTINVPTNGITVTYFGEMNTFSPDDFTNGTFDNWADNVYSSFGGNNPCGSTVGVSNTVDVAQSSAMNVLGILNSLSALSDLQSIADMANNSSSAVGGLNTNGVVESSKSGDEKEGDNKSNNTQSSGSTGTGSTGTGSTGTGTTETGSTGTTETGSTGTTETSTTGTGTTEPGSTGTGSTGTGTTEPGTTEPGTTPGSEEKSSSNILGGSVTSIQNGSSSGGSNKGPSKEGSKPSILLSSDFAGFNFKSGDATYGGKVTGGWSALNWDGSRSYGVMLDYTSANRGPNLTAFYAFVRKKRIDLLSLTATTSFYGKGSLYGTMAIGQMWTLTKSKKLKVIYMATSSYGNVFDVKFIGTAFIAGGMYDANIGKRTQIKFTNLFIYAPFISYYNDMVLKSPYVIMPIIGTNIGITKRFKLNLNLGGTYAIGEDVLNFTLMLGTRLAI